MNECLICKNIIPPERVICRECATKMLSGDKRYQIQFARGNGKTYLRRRINEDFKFYAKQTLKGE